MSSKSRVMLLSCGSFNPITHMHLRLFELARDYLNSTDRFLVVGGIISPVNDGYKKEGLLSSQHRCKMVDLALETSEWIRLDCWESDQEDWVPTRKVLEHHQNLLNSITNSNNSKESVAKRQKVDVDNLNYINNNEAKKKWDLSEPVRVMLLCGADMLETFAVPDLWEDCDIEHIVGKQGLVCITREGSNPERFIYDTDILTKYQIYLIC